MSLGSESEVAAELDLAALGGYLSQLGVSVAGPLTADLISGGRSNLTYVLSDGTSDWILRRPPKGMILAGAHDVAREYRVMAALAGTRVPVPGMVALNEDGSVLGVPFYVMDRIQGDVLRTRDIVAAVPESVRSKLGLALVDTLAELHEVDYQAIGLSQLGRPEGYLKRQVERWAKQFRAVEFREVPHVETIIDVLRSAIPDSGLVGIVHGDYRIDNVIVAPDDAGRITGVLDWEMATLGDPLADLATLVMFWDEPGKPFNPITAGLTAFAGFPSGDEVITRYLSRRNLAVDNVDWYLVFAEFRLAIILEQMHARHVAGQTLGSGFDGVGEMVITLLDSAMARVAASSTLTAPNQAI
jgi:aminoglycoside phosphotransferase (APT) family kinase protein